MLARIDRERRRKGRNYLEMGQAAGYLRFRVPPSFGPAEARKLGDMLGYLLDSGSTRCCSDVQQIQRQPATGNLDNATGVGRTDE